MQDFNEYRRPDSAKALLQAIHRLAPGHKTRIMEVCGTHTVAVFRAGIRSLLPESLVLISGPGCPVCVTSQGDIDSFIALAETPGVIAATFGDLMRVPGSRGSLAAAKARGADVRVVYSPLDAVDLARGEPESRVVFFAVGFETTAPTIAAAVLAAESRRMDNFFIAPAMKLIPPALVALIGAGDVEVDGFILPGHVSTIIGSAPYEEALAGKAIPGVITGFEPVDVLMGLFMLLEMTAEKKRGVRVQYKRAVSVGGNPRAREVMGRVFEPATVRWRGLGEIPESGLRLRDEFKSFDAAARLGVEVPDAPEPKGCRCGDVIKGTAVPPECPLYKKTCTPAAPVGPCMVSSEGTCAAYYRYSR